MCKSYTSIVWYIHACLAYITEVDLSMSDTVNCSSLGMYKSHARYTTYSVHTLEDVFLC